MPQLKRGTFTAKGKNPVVSTFEDAKTSYRVQQVINKFIIVRLIICNCLPLCSVLERQWSDETEQQDNYRRVSLRHIVY